MTAPVGVTAPTDATGVVASFLARLAAEDLEGAIELLAPRVEYVNVGLPTVRGARRVRAMFAWLHARGVRFEVYLHAISADDGIVLTERTDVLSLGRFRQQFWVAGRFEVVDGRIAVWRDYFDFLDIVRSAVRAGVGVAVPALRPRPPRPGDTPGR